MKIRYSTLSNEAEIMMGQSPPGDTYNVTGIGIPLLNGPTEFGAVYPTARQWTTSPTKICRRGDILFCVRGATAGRTNIADKEYCLGRGLAAIRVRQDRFDGRFLHHVLAAGYARFQARGVGSTFINISSEQLSKFQIPLFALSEQRRIGAILDQVADLKRMRVEALLRLATLGPAMYAEMFGDWRVAQSRWALVPLGSKLDFLTSGSRGWAEYYRDNGGRFLRIQNVKRDELDLSDLAFVEAPSTAEARRTRVKSGDVLLSITADLGRTAVVPVDIGEAYINQHLAILRSSKLDPRFLSAALASPAGQAEILKKNREGVKAGLNFDDVRSIRIPDAPVAMQHAFSSQMSEVDRLTCAYRTHVGKLDALFASLQDRAFRGELSSRGAERELAMAG